LNNAGIIVIAYSYQQQGLPTDALESAPQGPTYLYFINLFLTFVGLMIFYQYAKAKKTILYTN